MTELSLRGLHAKSQASFPVSYKEHYIGEYLADLLVEDQLIVELKCVALLINFQKPKVEWKRVIYDR